MDTDAADTLLATDTVTVGTVNTDAADTLWATDTLATLLATDCCYRHHHY